MTTWLRMLKGNPLPWLLEEETPAVRHLALRQLLDMPEDAPEVQVARDAAMQMDPIASILITDREPVGQVFAARRMSTCLSMGSDQRAAGAGTHPCRTASATRGTRY